MPRLLVIDDDGHVRELVPKLAYKVAGNALQVSRAADLNEALAICRATPVDVVLCDYFMAEHDGPELIRRIRASHPELRAMLMTGDASIAGKTLPESERPVRDKADLGAVVEEAVHMAMERL